MLAETLEQSSTAYFPVLYIGGLDSAARLPIFGVIGTDCQILFARTVAYLDSYNILRWLRQFCRDAPNSGRIQGA